MQLYLEQEIILSLPSTDLCLMSRTIPLKCILNVKGKDGSVLNLLRGEHGDGHTLLSPHVNHLISSL